jgi:hypothetical protein
MAVAVGQPHNPIDPADPAPARKVTLVRDRLPRENA